MCGRVRTCAGVRGRTFIRACTFELIVRHVRPLTPCHCAVILRSQTELKRATEARLIEPLQFKGGLQTGQQQINDAAVKMQAELQEVANALRFYDTELPGLTASVASLEEIKVRAKMRFARVRCTPPPPSSSLSLARAPSLRTLCAVRCATGGDRGWRWQPAQRAQVHPSACTPTPAGILARALTIDWPYSIPKANPIDLDAVVVATQPLYDQIMQLRAEHDAFEEMSRKMSAYLQVNEDTDLGKMVRNLRVKCYKKQFMVMLKLEKATKAAAAAAAAM